MKEKISIVIPCYNSAKMITTVVDGIRETVAGRKEYDYEIILVNDGSRDNTWEVIGRLAEENPNIKAVNFSKNFGQHNAMMAGYRQTTGDYILGMDDDGENDPHLMFQLIDKLLEGYDCVVAEYEEHRSRFRSLGTLLNNAMAETMLGKPKDITLTSYYVVRRFIIDQVIQYNNAYPYIAGLLLQATRNWGKVQIKRKERLEGQSGYTLKKLILLWINGFTAFSVKPLRLATCMGMGCSFIGFLWGAFLIIRKLAGVNVESGYTSMVACMVFFFGMIMIMLGIIGEYIGRIYISINNAPQYVIREVKQYKGDYDDKDSERKEQGSES
ncbi:MAG: glycosyltransferase family 2 protein [Bacteroidales bacterium]|nr:glycosyltransferase family 2 protein [Clostridium sp.]MCM1202900.1 glycosyltransferase family 2 protein [Bacteroidales bacterium]